jgi:hypothetical protein
MAQINRFYQPSRGQYVSQYIPQQLPTDLLIKGLAAKQDQFNKTLDDMNKNLGMWDVNSLQGYDTQYKNEWKKNIETKLDELSKKDLSLPENQQEYIGFLRKIRDDEGLKSVQSAYTTHQAFLKNLDEMKKDPTKYAPEYIDDYIRRYNIYTSGEGQGFKGDIKLGESTINAGADIPNEVKKFVDDLKANGSEWVNKLASGVSYESGWEGVSDTRVREQLDRSMESIMRGAVGRQLTARYDAANNPTNLPLNEYLSTLSTEDRNAYLQNRDKYIKNTVWDLGKEFVWGNSKSGKAAALETERTEAREDAKNNPVTPVFTYQGNTGEGPGRDFNKDRQVNQSTRNRISTANTELELLKTFKEKMEVGKLDQLDFSEMSEAQKSMVASIMRIPLSEVEQKFKGYANAGQVINKIIETRTKEIEFLKKDDEAFRQDIANSLNESLGNIFNGKDINTIMEEGKILERNDRVKEIANKINLLENSQTANTPATKNEIQRLKNDPLYRDWSAYQKAITHVNSAIDSPIPSVVNSYNNTGESAQYTMFGANKAEKYTSVSPIFENGQLKGFTSGVVNQTPDKQLENKIATNPSAFTIKDEDGTPLNTKLLKPGSFAMQGMRATKGPGDKVILQGYLEIKEPVLASNGKQVIKRIDDQEVPQFNIVPKFVSVEVDRSNYMDLQGDVYKSGALSNVNAVSDVKRVDVGGNKVDLIQLNSNASQAQRSNWTAYNTLIHSDLIREMDVVQSDLKKNNARKDIFLTDDAKVTVVNNNGKYTFIGGDQAEEATSWNELVNSLVNLRTITLIEEEKKRTQK